MIKNCMKRVVYSIPATATIREAAQLIADKRIGLLPVLEVNGRLLGVVSLSDLLSLELPDFFRLLGDLDFVHDFGAVETTRPAAELLDRQVTKIMQHAITVEENCGLLRAYSAMVKHNLYDLPVVSADGALVGLASRVDLGVAILQSWK